MARGLGRALQTVLAQAGPEEDIAIEGPSLANARRRNLLRYLCLRPCAHVGEVARVLNLSHATIRWHERDLLENGYLELDGVWTFPRGLIDPSDAALFGLLAIRGRSAVLAACYAEPGISLLELADHVALTRQSGSKVTSELTDAGLLTLVEDGRFRRHYPTELLVRKREANRPRARAFADALVHRLGQEGLAPEVLRTEETRLLVRLGSGTNRPLLDLPLDPYLTSWNSNP
jgi:DNA-binding MarR family transcriptional regulator